MNGSSPVASGSAIKPTAATSVPTTSLSLSKVLSSYVSETVLATSFSDKGIFKRNISVYNYYISTIDRFGTYAKRCDHWSDHCNS